MDMPMWLHKGQVIAGDSRLLRVLFSVDP